MVAQLTFLIIDSFLKGLGKAFAQDFIGDFATDFIEYLEDVDFRQGLTGAKPLYARAISVVQSSGTGKSRMLTEVCIYFGWQCDTTNFR
jgi:hypothetical protein